MGSTALQERGEGLGATASGEYRGLITAARFTDPQAEFAALRSGCAIFDSGFRTKISLTGGDRVRWLNGMFAWWGLFTWLPPYLSLPVEQGGRGLSVMNMTALMVVLNLFGMFPGYASFGWVADHIGRRTAFRVYSLVAALLIPFYAMARSQSMLLVVGTLVAFFGTGLFSGSGIMGSEIFPTAVRARALGFTYNGARTMSSLAPFVIGRVGQTKGLSWAFYLCAAGYLLAALVTTQLPETRGKKLE